MDFLLLFVDRLRQKVYGDVRNAKSLQFLSFKDSFNLQLLNLLPRREVREENSKIEESTHDAQKNSQLFPACHNPAKGWAISTLFSLPS